MAEREIINIIKAAYPDHSILAEESGAQEGNDFVWVIDPLDGTTNFLHGFPAIRRFHCLKTQRQD